MNKVQVHLPKKVLFNCTLSVRISDINYGGHLSNDAILSFAHEARIRFLNHFGYTEFDIGGCGIIMIDAAITYLSEGFLGNDIRIEIMVGDPANAGFDIFYRMHNLTTGKDLAHVKTGVLAFDYEKKKVRKLPDTFKKILKTAHDGIEE